MVPFAGWEMAVQFEGVIAEHKAVRSSCGVFDISHMGLLKLKGLGAKDKLQGLVPSDLHRIGPGEAIYSVLLNEGGGIIDDLIIYDRGQIAGIDELFVVINAACVAADTAWLEQHLSPQGIEISDQKTTGVLLALQGPEAAAKLQQLCGEDLSGLPRFGHRTSELRRQDHAVTVLAQAEPTVAKESFVSLSEVRFELGATVLAQAPAPAPALAPEPNAPPATEPAAAAGPLFRWSTSAGYNHYREPSIDMELQGPELGLHLRVSQLPRLPRWQAEADVLGSLQRYDSPSGRLKNVENLETRWRLLYQIWPQNDQGLFVGPALHTLHNNLRGITDRGAAGYQRENLGVWLALQWRQTLSADGPLSSLSSLSNLQVDAGRLLRARHNSYLSQANRNYPDIGNTQRKGFYVQAKLGFKAENLLLQPFVRYTHLDDSDVTTVALRGSTLTGTLTGIEPASQRWQVGLQVSWPAR